MIRMEVLEPQGRAARLYEFDGPEVRIGYRPGLDLCLKGSGGELRVALEAGKGYSVQAVSREGADFVMNGEPIAAVRALADGSIITRAGLTLRVVRTDWAGKPSGGGAENAPTTQPEGVAGAPGKPAVKPAESNYLVLFLAPVKPYLEDPEVSEILINGPDRIYVERKGKLQRTDVRFLNEQALEAAMRNIARHVGRRFDEDQPRLDARLPDGSRVHAVLPPMSREGTTVAIRKFSKDKLTMPQLVKYGSISIEGAKLIEAIVRLGKNIIVSGPTSSGKTSVLNVLSSFIPNGERILVIEDASELQLQQEHAVLFETRKPDEHGKGEVSIRDLVHSSLRLRPDRLVVGEIRGAEALDLLQAMNTGHSGSMTTIHANGPKDALSRLETCALLSGVEIPLYALRDQVRAAIQVVIHTARLTDGSRKITHVTEVLGVEGNDYKVQDLLRFRIHRMAEDGKLFGCHEGTGAMPTFMDEARMRGLSLNTDWFAVPATVPAA